MAWVTWRQHRSQLVAGLALLVGPRRHRARHAPADPRGVPPRRGRGLPAAVGACGLRPDRPALRERVRRLGGRRARARRAAGARRSLRRRAAARPRARARHAPLRVDAGRHPAALAALEDGVPRARHRRRGGARERADDVVAEPVRHARGPHDPARLRHRRPGRSGLRALRAGRRRARRPRPAAHGRRDVGHADRLRGDAPGRPQVPAPALPRGAAPDRGRDRLGPRRGGLGAQRHARRRRRAEHHRGARGSGDPARAAGRHRPARVPRHARLAAHDLVPAATGGSGRSSCSRPASSSCWPCSSSRARSGSSAGHRHDGRRGSIGRRRCGSRRSPRPLRRFPNGAAAAGRRPVPPAASALAHRLHQPRADESVLRAGDERQRRRLQAARGDVRVDGLGEQRRRRDGEGDAPGDRHQGRRDRRLDHRPVGVRRPDRRRARARHPGRRVQRRRRQGEQAARVHRPGSLRVRPRVRRAHRRPRRAAATSSSSSRRRASRTSSRASTARSTRSATRGGRSTSRSWPPAST